MRRVIVVSLCVMKISGYRLLGPVSQGLFGLFNGVIWFIVGLVVLNEN